MKQVKSLMLALLLVFALSVGAQAGDISSPGIKTPPPIGPSSPGSQTTVDISGSNAMLTIEVTDDISEQVMMDILLALIALI